MHPLRTHNRDTGSLNVGSTDVSVGDRIHILGEREPRKVTYVMGRVARSTLHVVCRGTGPMPLGDVEFLVLRSAEADLHLAVSSAQACAPPSPPPVRPRGDSGPRRRGAPLYKAGTAEEAGVPRIPTVASDRLPRRVLHADWGMHGHKRRQAQAVLGKDGLYVATATREVASPRALPSKLLRHASTSAGVLAGFDFAIGFPIAFARQAGVLDFLSVLPVLGTGEWQDFFQVAEQASQIATRRPFYPRSAKTKGSVRQADLCRSLGAANMDALRRRCDRKTENRPPAEVMFWTLGKRQVGKGVISGWRDMLQPSLSLLGTRLRLWPFEGCLQELLAPNSLVVVETYPGEFYGHFGFTVSKRVQSSRRSAGEALLGWARQAQVRVTHRLEAQLSDGFGPSADGEDDFDAVVGLFGMLNVLLGHRSPGEPDEDEIRRVEGWMFGMGSS